MSLALVRAELGLARARTLSGERDDAHALLSVLVRNTALLSLPAIQNRALESTPSVSW